MHGCDRCGAELPSGVGERAIVQTVANERGSSPRPVVLVADDSELVRRIAETTLSAAGFRVVLAVDGEGALAAAEREAPQVVVLVEEKLAFRVGTVLREQAAASSVEGCGAGRSEPELCAACAPVEERPAAPGP